MRHEPPPQLVAELPQAGRLVSVSHEGNQPGHPSGERATRGAPLRAITRAALCPPDRSAQARRPERIRGQQLFHKDAHRALECVQHIVQRHDRTGNQVAPKEIEVLFRAAVGVVAVNPQKPDRPGPCSGQIARIRAVRFDAVLDGARAE